MGNSYCLIIAMRAVEPFLDNVLTTKPADGIVRVMAEITWSDTLFQGVSSCPTTATHRSRSSQRALTARRS